MSLAVLLWLVLLAGVAWIYDLTEPLFMMIVMPSRGATSS